MTLQFPCPQGHLLEADESRQGQLCSCPTCGTEFIIPERPSAAAANRPPITAPPVVSSPPAGARSSDADAPVIALTTSGRETRHGLAIAAGDAEPAVLHIPCPNGHQLETPAEMLGQYVMCPHCRVQYRLREQDSVEYQRTKRQEEEAKERRAGKIWLHWAVLISVLVLLGLLGLILASATGLLR
jgi:uncharacterized Zn finger protein (UPF0148 family)